MSRDLSYTFGGVGPVPEKTRNVRATRLSTLSPGLLSAFFILLIHYQFSLDSESRTATQFPHPPHRTSTFIPKMVSASALEAFEKNDVELTVPPGEPRPVLLIVMVSLEGMSPRNHD